MDILIDTNIFIHREDSKIVPKPLQKLERSLNEAGHTIKIHPYSIREIRSDKDEERRKKAESRIETYVELSYPPTPHSSNESFRQYVSEASSFNETVDNMLLYAVFKDEVDFLVTEDRKMHSKALELDIQDRVFTIEEASDFFKEDKPPVRGPAAIERKTLGDLDLKDPIFDSLKDEYEEFVEWAEAKAERPAWVNYCEDGQLGAILALKLNEVEDIGADPPLGREKRLKISTLKVAEPRWGSKVGELLISIAIREAVNHELDQVYLTHYVEEEDYLVKLLSDYGFERASSREDGEAIFRKLLTPGPDSDLTPVGIAQRFYPSFYDGEDVKKILVPIQPNYHRKLFTAYHRRQPPLSEFMGEFHSEGNAIRKAYLSHSKSKQIETGDILLFYRSSDYQEVTSIGVCEDVSFHLTSSDEIQRIVGKRSVFSDSEIKKLAEKPTTVILFSWHFDLQNPVSYQKLRANNVISGPPQSMQSISEEGYKYIKRESDLDERFALD